MRWPLVAAVAADAIYVFDGGRTTGNAGPRFHTNLVCGLVAAARGITPSCGSIFSLLSYSGDDLYAARVPGTGVRFSSTAPVVGIAFGASGATTTIAANWASFMNAAGGYDPNFPGAYKYMMQPSDYTFWNGVGGAFTCNEWTSASDSDRGEQGSSGGVGFNTMATGNVACSNTNAHFCVCVPPLPPTASPAASPTSAAPSMRKRHHRG